MLLTQAQLLPGRSPPRKFTARLPNGQGASKSSPGQGVGLCIYNQLQGFSRRDTPERHGKGPRPISQTWGASGVYGKRDSQRG